MNGVAVVDAPTALTGFLLAMRLPRYRCRNAQDGEGRWHVSVELVDQERLPALIAAVEEWLKREQIGTTQLRVGDDVHRLRTGGAAGGDVTC